MPANNFQAMTCVPEVSLLDPNEIVRTEGDDKLSYKLWRKHKKPSVAVTDLPAPIVQGSSPSPQCTCEDRVAHLTATVERQQQEMEQLRNENAELRKDHDEMKQSFLKLTQKIDQLMNQHNTDGSPPQPADHHHQQYVGRWSLPGEKSFEGIGHRSPEARVLGERSYGAPPPPQPDKSQMMNHLFRKYFPQSDENENVSPSNKPIFEFNEEQEKSMATFNYLSKYKLLGSNSNDRVLDGIAKRRTKH